jgi:hypothetical protein
LGKRKCNITFTFFAFASDRKAAKAGFDMQQQGTSEQAAQHTNGLVNASSSYLRSAIHQPVDWQEWGEAAFARAREQGKPVLLDIGAGLRRSSTAISLPSK